MTKTDPFDTSKKNETPEIPVVAENADGKKAVSTAVEDTDSKVDTAIKPEKKETIDHPKLRVAQECKNAAGKYVSLNKKQRTSLGINVGDSVEAFDEGGKSLGLFSVGLGANELKDQEGVFAANGINMEQTVTLKKVENKEINESLPAFEIKANENQKRTKVITKRFPGWEETYITIPTGIALQIEGVKKSPKKETKGLISKVVIEVNGKDQEMVIVPGGEVYGITQEAAKKIGVVTGDDIEFRVADGKLIVKKQKLEKK